MKLWKRFLSLFLVLQVVIGSSLPSSAKSVTKGKVTQRTGIQPVVTKRAAARPVAPKPVTTKSVGKPTAPKPTTAKPVKQKTAAQPAVAKGVTARPAAKRASARPLAPKPVADKPAGKPTALSPTVAKPVNQKTVAAPAAQPQGNAVTKLTDQELQKCALSGVHKKDWAQRLQWFESKIINHYKGLSKKNILVVGPQKFLDAFKVATQKHNWNANFTYAAKANSPEMAGGGLDLVIDAQYTPQHFKRIYGNLNVSSFKDVYAEILYDETLTFLEKNGVKYYFFEIPIKAKIKNLDDFEKNEVRRKGITDFNKGKHKDFIQKVCGTNQEVVDYVTNRMRLPSFYNGKYIAIKDSKNKYCEAFNGSRSTFKAPKFSKNKIHFFGACTAEGIETPDKYTIESYLQEKLYINFRNTFGVVNNGVRATNYINDFEHMLDTEFKPGDIVIQLREVFTKKIQGKPCFETSHLFDRPHNHGYWMLDNSFHINHVGNEVIANYIYEVLKPQLSKAGAEAAKTPVKYQFENEADTFLDDNPDFKRYLEGLKTIKAQTKATGKVGSIVMNCNPFTLGHRYLIERAAAQVGHLYIFVVEEDKSVFPFKDRLELVKKGTADLGDKVTILPSGKWIISLLTFPEYFNKDDLQGAAIDPSKDINLFGKYIAPTLGINMRFVGEEPFDKVTRQYNETMKNILPSFGVSFHEIPRKATDGKDDVISATKVRNALKAGDFETLKKYVPESTLNYLKENYEQIFKAINSKYKAC